MIRVYRFGIHKGEEPVISGNHAAGMVYISGCHLKCSFCYTPEISRHHGGHALSEKAFFHQVLALIDQGAQNINLVSPTHQWRGLEAVLTRLKETNLPIVLKTSGYEPPELAARMLEIADIMVPDYKVHTAESAKRVGLPPSYGTVAQSLVEQSLETHGNTLYDANGRIKRGLLVRHLLMPGFEAQSLTVIDKLKEVGFGGAFNLMTHFVDTTRKRLITAPPQHVDLLAKKAEGAGMQVLIDGKMLYREQDEGVAHAS